MHIDHLKLTTTLYTKGLSILLRIGYQLPWRNSLQESGSTDEGAMGVMSRGHTHHSPILTRGNS